MHDSKQLATKARCLAKMVMAVVKRKDTPKCDEIDQMAQEAQYILIDTKELEDENGRSP
jgi:hypothetical protein